MIRRLSSLVSMTLLVTACSGSIYRQRPVVGELPTAITVDARQRVLLSQLGPIERANPAGRDPLFRRFCAEPSPDVFTVLGVSASGSGSLGLGADKSVNAALQAAFSSSETGATIARTQTVNMLREMMFRTCERYLSGSISRDEFSIIAARDQRIMVSILAIEQLTGAVTPPRTVIAVGGTAQTGFDATQVVKALAEAQGNVDSAAEEVKAKQQAVDKADKDAGGCAALRTKKADGTSLKPDENDKLATCNKADDDLKEAKARRDEAQSRYDVLVAASKKGIGVSSAGTTGTFNVSDDHARAEAVKEVAQSVTEIVARTFDQDETQLFCIRVMDPESPAWKIPELRRLCVGYLNTKVTAEAHSLAMRYGLSDRTFYTLFDKGQGAQVTLQVRAQKLSECVAAPEKKPGVAAILRDNPVFAGSAQQFLEAMQAGRGEDYLRRQGTAREAQIAGALNEVCGLGE